MTPLERAAVAHVTDIRAGRAWAESFEKLAAAVDAVEPIPDTQPAPPMPPEPITKPATPIPIKRASGEHKLDIHGLAATTAQILAEGKEGPPSRRKV